MHAPRKMRVNNSITIRDRRLTMRYSLRTPLQIRILGSNDPCHRAESIDFSGRGALLETELPLKVGSAVELHLKLPEELTGQPATEWHLPSALNLSTGTVDLTSNKEEH